MFAEKEPTETELFEVLEKAEEDVKEGRVASIEKTFKELRLFLKKSKSSH